MKRILTGLFLGVVSMFFTGCSEALVKGIDVPKEEWMSAADDLTQSADKESGASETMEDYYEYNEEEKYKDLEGENAFAFQTGHLEEDGKIEDFQILDMLNDNTFLYLYSVANPSAQGGTRVVHCAAVYNFRTKQLKVVHESEFFRDEEAQDESFFGQWCSGGSDKGAGTLFVYDNGVGSLYDLNTLSGVPEFQTDVETFMRRYFSKPVSVNTANAVSDGENNIYIELLLEKEGLLDKYEDVSDEQLENDFIQVVMAYEFVPLASNMHLRQDNESFEKQVEEWKNMAEGNVFDSEPDEAADWEAAIKKYPNKWKEAYIPELDNLGIKQWKTNPVYGYEQDGYVCTFQAKGEGELTSLTNPPEKQILNNALVTCQGYDYTLCAYLGGFSDCSPREISRDVTVKTGTDENGEDITETVTQSMTVYEKREQIMYSILSDDEGNRQGPWLEGYRILKKDNEYVSTLYGESDSDILCEVSGKLYWMSTQKNFTQCSIPYDENDRISFFTDSGQTGLVSSDGKELIIYDNLGKAETPRGVTVDLQALESRYKSEAGKGICPDYPTDTKYEGTYNYTNYLNYEGNNILKVKVSGCSVMDKLKENWGVDLLGLRSGESAEAFLFSSETEGMNIYVPGTEKSFCLDDGSWYRSWKLNDGCAAVGFNNNFALSGGDAAYARVMEFDVQKLLEQAAQELLVRYEEDAEQAAQKESEEASKAADDDRNMDLEEEWRNLYDGMQKGN